MNNQLCQVLPAALIILLWMDMGALSMNATCPIGFELLERKDASSLCIRIKGPETFADKYKDCPGNLHSSKLYQDVKNMKLLTKKNVWIEYKSMHPGGIFVDWSYSKNMGEEFKYEYNLTLDPDLDMEKELCLIKNEFETFTVVKCTELYYRYCVVRPYYSDLSSKGCDDLKDGKRFYSPESTCLSLLSGVRGGPVRATWHQAQDLCLKKGGSLLNRGFIYTNHNKIVKSSSHHIYPLGIVMDSNYETMRYNTTDDQSEIPIEKWYLKENYVPGEETFLGSVQNNIWELVNSSFIFYDVICERRVPLKHISMQLNLDVENKLTLTVNEKLDVDSINCFTDSVDRHPVKISISKMDDKKFILKPKQNGYYWCTHIKTKIYKVSETKKQLFIREKVSVAKNYAVKIRLRDDIPYKLDELPNLLNTTEIKLREYILLRNKYGSNFKNISSHVTRDVVDTVMEYYSGVSLKTKLKRLYIDRRSMLLHIELSPRLGPVEPGMWKEMDIISMKPVYYCKSFDSVPQLFLGESISLLTSAGCQAHTCVGDFNEGVQWVTTASSNCTEKPKENISETKGGAKFDDAMPTISIDEKTDTTDQTDINIGDSSEEVSVTTDIGTTKKKPIPICSTTPDYISTVDYTPTTPGYESTTDSTVTPIQSTPTTSTVQPIEDKLQEVVQNLEQLINNGSAKIEDVEPMFDQVDGILEAPDNVQISGQFLHLLEKLGPTIVLNGSSSAFLVRNNIALAVADSGPNNPIRGLKIGTRQTDNFNNGSFEMIKGEINSTELSTDLNEMVVYLPQSVSDTTQRLSFVVFRNDRAFQSSKGTFSVNSRVLNVKVGNVTKFHKGEVIDIHLSPLSSDLDRNISRTCAYWEFLEDGNGYWSQEGCRLIISGPGKLDICRCTHLTHFAEVLFPRAVFSETNENTLRILTIIGCSLSIFGVIFVGITSTLFRSWRREFSNKIWLQLCISIFILALSFLIIVFTKFDHYNVFCMLLGIFLHYSVLSSFCWMLVAAILSYRRLVLVFTRDVSHKLLRTSAFSWGAPFAVIGVLLSIAPHSYSGHFVDKTPNGTFCYPSGLGLWLSVYLPIALTLLVNWTLFGLIVRSVFASRTIQRHGDTNEAFRCASVSCLLVFLFGLPWIFGLLAFNIVAAYLFTLTATFQGFILFIFFILGNKKTRDLWLNKLKIKQTRKVPVTSSTYSNRSTVWRGATPNVTFEAKASKPKSLNQDNSRFS